MTSMFAKISDLRVPVRFPRIRCKTRGRKKRETTQVMLDVLTPLSDCRQESVQRWIGDFGGFVHVLDRFPQRDLGLWVFMCPINFSDSFPATTPRATTPHRSFRLPQRGLPRPTALFPATTPLHTCLLYTSPSPRDGLLSRMPSSA